MKTDNYRITNIKQPQLIKQEPYVDNEGIYVPTEPYVYEGTSCYYRMLISKEMFVEAYSKWIKGDNNETLD
jgi:hypothetical protein